MQWANAAEDSTSIPDSKFIKQSHYPLTIAKGDTSPLMAVVREEALSAQRRAFHWHVGVQAGRGRGGAPGGASSSRGEHRVVLMSGSVTGATAGPPPGYIPGVGRGATGLGDTRNKGTYSMAEMKKKQEAEREHGPDLTRVLGSAQFRHGGTGDAEDKEADQIYDEVDARMAERRKRPLDDDSEGAKPKRSKLEFQHASEVFSDAKVKLASMSVSDWDAIPDAVADLSGQNRLLKAQERASRSSAPVTDRLILEGRGASGTAAAVVETDSLVGSGESTDLSGVGVARNRMLDIKLSRVEDSVSGQTVVDPQGFMTSLQQKRGAFDVDIADVQRGRLLMRSLINSNPDNSQGWVAAARFEEAAQKLGAARRIIKEGCLKCPHSEEVWLEAARLCKPEEAQGILAQAVLHVPTSVGVWMRAASLEAGEVEKKAVLRRAIEVIPTSVKLWKAAVELEDAESARIMLAQAVQCVPQSLELWLGLARLETYDNAKKVLNRAHKAMPQEPRVFEAAARLEEEQGHPDKVEAIIRIAVGKITKAKRATTEEGDGLKLSDREEWLELAKSSEAASCPLTAASVVEHTIGMGIAPEEELRTWMADALQLENQGKPMCARAVLRHALSKYKDRKALWLRAAELERKVGDAATLEAILREAVTHCPKVEELWLLAARLKLDEDNLSGARTVLEEAFMVNTGSEAILLAAVKLEREHGSVERARALLERARESAGTERIWLKSAMLELEEGDPVAAETLLKAGLKAHTDADKLWMVLIGIYERSGDVAKAEQLYGAALKFCGKSVALWRLAARLHERVNGIPKARSVLELGRVKNPKSALLWVDSIRLEDRAGQPAVAESLLSQAMNECPASAVLWTERLQRAPKVEHSGISKQAITKLDKNGEFAVTVARLLWRDSKADAARRWFERAVTLAPSVADTWLNFYRFEQEQGTPETVEAVRTRALQAPLKYGEHWAPIAKHLAHCKLALPVVFEMASLALPSVTSSVRGAKVWGVEEDWGAVDPRLLSKAQASVPASSSSDAAASSSTSKAV
jgi:pre-mRNA-processing factor 6